MALVLKIMLRCLFTVCVIAVGGISQGAEMPASSNSVVSNLAPGQMWSIRSDPPTSAKVVIGRIEQLGSGKIVVHVSLRDVPAAPDGPDASRLTNMAHMPFDKNALVSSLDRMLAADAQVQPDFEEGYATWQMEKGGVFTISVPKAIEVLQEVLSRTAR